ncbi:MAG: exodeoxyribonuclease VII large subunit [Balneolaceae bacterium]|nr:MAG: exodeoxyribonuclease VII large subunit [Balneolaceae bacterium]
MNTTGKFTSTHVPSVSELTGGIKMLLESEFNGIRVEGEVSKPVQSANGHIYFTLKDKNAQLSCVMWRSSAQRMGAGLLHGQQIIAEGDIQVYAPQGRYQLIVGSVMQAGAGALQLAFEELKKKLENEGLFSPAHKKQLPAFPKSIGVVTSESGAAFHDIVSTLQKRFPMVEVRLYHASVQGVAAAGEIVQGIRFFSQVSPVDVLIVTRGGGSLEDLWPFNEEAVARAIFECTIPVISAVGHETDFSISDFVADERAATPTQAVILAVPDLNELKMFVDEAGNLIQRKLDDMIQRNKDLVQRLIRSHGLQVLERKLGFARERLRNTEVLMLQYLKSKTGTGRDRIGHLHYRLVQNMSQRTLRASERLQLLQSRLESLNPDAPLKRGFTRVMQDGHWIRISTALNSVAPLEIIWHDGKVRIN